MAVISISCIIALLAAALLVWQYRRRQWDNRSVLLCLACGETRQPERASANRLRCPSCAALGPVLTGSPQALAYLARKAAPPVDKVPLPAAKVWTPRHRDDDDITRYG